MNKLRSLVIRGQPFIFVSKKKHTHFFINNFSINAVYPQISKNMDHVVL